jgi:non-specific serine/threonine protein kinase
VQDEERLAPHTAEWEGPPSHSIFLSYRRDDASAYAILLYESLSARYGNNVFMDIDSLAPGVDFVDATDQILKHCEVLFALIGRRWLTSLDAEGNPRLENPEDFVRLEIEVALARNIRVVPLLVGGAVMPKSTQLPGELSRLARRHAFELSDTRWHTDVAALIKAIEGGSDSSHAAGAEIEDSVAAAKERSLLGLWNGPAAMHNLPAQLSSFVGRDHEMVEIRKLIEDHRLVTLTGSGGVGKTRLAHQVAGESLDEFAEGVWLVELASVADPELVTPAVASALGVREEPARPLLETLLNALSDRHLLVVLDNCEHVLASSAVLADTLLRACPGLRIMATSREPLGVTGEHVYRVPSLSLPEPGQILLPDKARSFDAVHLFIERAVAHDSTFHLSFDTAATVASLCRELDGMPLAIELAAARVSSLSVEEIERRLGDRFSLLTRGDSTALPRHQTLRALIDWSYDLLDEQEQATLCRLSTFVGGWSLEAAEAVLPHAGPEALDVVDVLGSLVDKSLVQVDPASNGARRYRLLETIRQYCTEQFSNLAPSEQASTRLAHAEFFLSLAEEAAPHLMRTHRSEWFDRIALDLGNFRVAMAYFASDPTSVDQALRMCVAIRYSWFYAPWGYHTQGIDELEAVLSRANDDPPSGLRASALVAVAYLHWEQGDYAIARAQFEEAFETGKLIGDRAVMARALGGSSQVALRQGNFTTALDLAQEAVELAMASGDPAVIAYELDHRGEAKSACGDSTDRFDLEDALAGFLKLDDRFGISGVLQGLAIRELKDGNLDAARARINESLDLSRELPEPSYGELVLLGLVELLNGDAHAASRAYRQLLAVARRGGLKTATGYALLGMGFCATLADDPHRAARLHGAADALFETIGEALDPDLLNFRNGDRRQLRTIMGDRAFEADYRSGGNLTLQAAVDLVMEEPIGQ